MLEIKDLHVSYGGIQALRGVSLNVPDGKIVTLIGANGAGKSTLMRTISGLVKAQSGSILWNGQELLGKPKLLMLDEPSLGLAPIVVREIFDIIRTVNQQGITVLLNEQNANMALKVADYAYVLETGTLTLSGTGAELLTNEQVKTAYLGKKRVDRT